LKTAPDEAAVDWVAAVLSHVTASEQRWTLVRLAVREGGAFTHAQAKDELGVTSSGALTTHLDPLVDAFIFEKAERAYLLTAWGRFAYRLLVYGATGRPGSDLEGTRLLAVTRPRTLDPDEILGALQPSARTVIRTDGQFRYLAVFEDDPDSVEQVLFSLQQRGADGAVLRVAQVE
jgi:hypothetical protein